MLFGANIKYLRALKGLTQAELGDVLGVKGATVTGWETGKSSPHFEVLLKLRDFFQVDLESLVYRDLQKESRPSQKSDSMLVELYEQLKTRMDAMESRMQQMEKSKA